jgi:hypothetical protein
MLRKSRETMLKKISRLFIIKTRFEACLIIYALALGACERGIHYMEQFPGLGGKLLFAAATGSVFLAGAKIFDCLRFEKERREAAALERPAG